MKTNRLILWALALTLAGIGMSGCDAEKEAIERRNFMIPKKSEMARNDRYKGVDKRKTNKVKMYKSKRKKLF